MRDAAAKVRNVPIVDKPRAYSTEPRPETRRAFGRTGDSGCDKVRIGPREFPTGTRAHESQHNDRTQRATGRPGRAAAPRLAKAERVDFPVVGLGASAGGLDTFKRFFDALPADCGMAFVLIQHSIRSTRA